MRQIQVLLIQVCAACLQQIKQILIHADYKCKEEISLTG